ncbi:MAG TPA: hypothetical protein VLA62_06850 [Solirubrobacterales bacterium]|nr:hypothetical protein [Solirubrobacterales bacterium]
MSEPDPAFEKKVLRDVAEQMRDPAETQRQQGVLRKAVAGGGMAGLVAAFFLAINELGHPFLAAFLAAAAGCATGFGLLLGLVHRQWPVTRRHIDMESVRRRLQELGG